MHCVLVATQDALCTRDALCTQESLCTRDALCTWDALCTRSCYPKSNSATAIATIPYPVKAPGILFTFCETPCTGSAAFLSKFSNSPIHW